MAFKTIVIAAALAALGSAAAIPELVERQYPAPLFGANFTSGPGCDPTHGTTKLELFSLAAGLDSECVTLSQATFGVVRSAKILNYEYPGCQAVFSLNTDCTPDQGFAAPVGQCVQGNSAFQSVKLTCPAGHPTKT